MFFKNLQVYRLPAPWNKTAEQLMAELGPQTFAPASSNELLRRGWAAPRCDGQLVHAVAGQFLLLLQTETKLLPASVINQAAKMRAAELEESQGFAPGKKAMKELKERVADELLPRAFSVLSRTHVWIDPVNGWLMVDSASPSRADDAIKLLLKAIDRMPLESLRVMRSPVAVMTAWLETDEAPAGFTVDQDATMRAAGESRASVRYVRHALEVDDVRRHIAAGKQCTRLAMTWNDKVSFVLDETLAIKSVRALDVIKENDASTRNDSERFDNDMVLMTGELAKLLADLVEALGGEAGDLVSPAGPVAGPARGDEPECEQAPVGQRKLERAVGLTAELYKVREMHHEILGELYGDTVKPAIDRVRERMAAAGEGAIKAAIELANAMPVGSSAAQLFLVAAVEIMEPSSPAATDGSGTDPLYEQAVGIVRANQRASISLVQRHLRIGYSRAARLLDSMENQGVVSAMQSNGNRDILILEAIR